MKTLQIAILFVTFPVLWITSGCMRSVSTAVAPADAETATVSGTVADARGVRIPGVEIVLSDASAGNSSELTSAVTDRTGTYEIPGIAPGVYRLTASMPGFRPVTWQNVRAVQGRPLRFDFSLALER